MGLSCVNVEGNILRLCGIMSCSICYANVSYVIVDYVVVFRYLLGDVTDVMHRLVTDCDVIWLLLLVLYEHYQVVVVVVAVVVMGFVLYRWQLLLITSSATYSLLFTHDLITLCLTDSLFDRVSAGRSTAQVWFFNLWISEIVYPDFRLL